VWYLVLAAGFMALALGLVDYLEVPARWRRLAQAATLLPTAVYAVMICVIGLTELRIPRSIAQLPIAVTFLSMGALALWADRRERGAGHAMVGITLLAMPVVGFVLAALRADSVALRIFAFGPLIVLALTLLTVSLLRRRRALEEEVARRQAAEAELTRLNASLEMTVAERTADLHELIDGLESFNRSVSHDLRGSLGGIAGVARLSIDALEQGDDAYARRSLVLIAEQAESSTRLMAALLSLARVGDSALRRESVDLARLIDEVVRQLDRERDGGLPPIEVAPALPVARADPDLLRLVFANLLGNAVKFTRDAPAPRIEVDARSTEHGVEVSVGDNGVGFDAAVAAQLFRPFVRLHGARFEGHGLGLSIVRRVIERHGGRVHAEPRPGGGALFRFSLPG
jgi:signal transduction histidine kinase